ncbi:MAG TPA: hypothetical protein VGJ26_09000 [Pirellulales bacterium]|jgi:hypothetical protein
MKIVGIDGMTPQQLQTELEHGARFVIYKYCVSIFIMTFQRPSDIRFVRAGESAVGKGLGYTLISLFCGWWGIPWGPIYTIGSVASNFRGGVDVTKEVVASLQLGGE